ncbi:CsbD family protein [Palleronia sp. LCG004]|uniref:CsbD family protein n=1 Tax=Palleronia sp. LCG004 TaxID=3079304 RepID=UPI002941EDA6|nr:CsbD family protein [Palleronia sp. LCG004]WOI55666.1 CsbD family protein [Palleronia sp. LCG004]
MNDNTTKGTVKNLAGKAKEAAGNLTNNERLEAEGKADQVEGRAQKTAGEAEKTLKGK